MALAGFFAEASVYSSSRSYRSVGASGAGVFNSSRESGIQSALGTCTPFCGPCLPSSGSSTGCSKSCMTAACETYEVSCTGCKITCPPGTTLCGTHCVDLSNDRQNCGACNVSCAPDEICSGGTCRECGARYSACGNKCCRDDVEDCCNGVCMDVTSDPNNCGSCRHSCNGGSCSGGLCGNCPSGFALCGGTCVNLQTDANNCGSCGNVCKPGVGCRGGLCQCSCPGPQYCNWTYNNTVCNVNSDGVNVPFAAITYNFNNTPPGWDPVDTCYCTLGPQGTPMANRTPDLCQQTRILGILTGVTGIWYNVPSSNCCLEVGPVCGSVCCPVYGNGTAECLNGMCQIGCNPGFTFCGGSGGPTGCFDLTSDHQHCGSCTNQCGIYEDCVNGQCQSQQSCPLVGQIKCGNTCVTPTCSRLCPSGNAQTYLAEEANSKCFLGFYLANSAAEATQCAQESGFTATVGSAKSGGNYSYAVTCPGYSCEPATNVIALSPQDGQACIQSRNVNCTVKQGTC